MSDNTKRILRLHTDLSRVLADERFDDGRPKGHELRGLIIAYYWARFEGGDRETVWKRTMTLAGLRTHGGEDLQRHRLRELYRLDAPRYEPTDYYQHWRSPCQVPMQRGPRAGEPCGRPPSLSFRVTDRETGEWTMRGWCSRHRAEGERVSRYERSAPPPVRKPLPNTGGLLPCHIKATNWPDIYKSADSRWEPPSIGICADDWPVLRRVEEHAVDARLRFTAIDGDAEADGTETPLPTLRLVLS